MNDKETSLFDYPKRMTFTRSQRDVIVRGLRLLVSYNQVTDNDLTWRALELIKLFEDTEKEVREWEFPGQNNSSGR